MEPLNLAKGRKRVYTPNGVPAPKQKVIATIATQFEQEAKKDEMECDEKKKDDEKEKDDRKHKVQIIHQNATAHWEGVAARLEKRSESKEPEAGISELLKKLSNKDQAEASKAPRKSTPLPAAKSVKHDRLAAWIAKRPVEEKSKNLNANTTVSTEVKDPALTHTESSPSNDPQANQPANKTLPKSSSFWGPSGPPPSAPLPSLPTEIVTTARKAEEKEKARNRALRAEDQKGGMSREITEFDLSFCPDPEQED